MIRKRGYALRGKKVAIRGDFERKPRGTFDRVEFTKCCQDFVHCPRRPVRQYPGCNSVWILDGATIHRHPEIIHYLRSVEFLFGYVKRSFQRHYLECSGRDLLPFVVQTFRRFQALYMSKIFQHCGWKIQGYFDPVGPLSIERRAQPELTVEGSSPDELKFTDIEAES
ncbi:hypothetical protein JG688_00012431 [Phytophthora aleatoria]|uniref:Uncharacterized protein n=1 Tax=Phytophthora aleatoria TaxID=2496075 RepID=A0A8J5M4M4_9STRA|nr:hypothetical protein JG688_00012431 [Phytophthora aleatoria]